MTQQRNKRRYAGGKKKETAFMNQIVGTKKNRDLQVKVKQICSPFEIRLSRTGPTQIKLKQRNTIVSQTTPHGQSSDADKEKSKNDVSDAQNFLNIDYSDKRKHVEIKPDYPAYRQTKLILSGDVEIQPGPETTTYPPNTDAKSQEANRSENLSRREEDVRRTVNSSKRYYVDHDAPESESIKHRWWHNLRECGYKDDYWYSIHPTYHQNKLLTSGDIEENPGPETKKQNNKPNPANQRPGPQETSRHKDISRILKYYGCIALLLLTLLLLLYVSTHNIKITENTPQLKPKLPTYSYLKQGFNMVCNLLRLRNLKKRMNIKIRTRAAYLVLLLIIAGDIHPHPGPNKEDSCLRCHQAESKDQEAVNCETCKGWCHLNCTETSKETTQILHKSFEWLCPNPTCQPNHHVGIQGTVQPTTNKFESLNISQAEAVTKRSKCKNNLIGKYSSKAKRKSKELQQDTGEENSSDKGNLPKH